MSINLVTMGMFQGCCGRTISGGGAPPYRIDNEEVVRPLVLVKKFEAKDTDTIETLIKQIKITLIDELMEDK